MSGINSKIRKIYKKAQSDSNKEFNYSTNVFGGALDKTNLQRRIEEIYKKSQDAGNKEFNYSTNIFGGSISDRFREIYAEQNYEGGEMHKIIGGTIDELKMQIKNLQNLKKEIKKTKGSGIGKTIKAAKKTIKSATKKAKAIDDKYGISTVISKNLTEQQKEKLRKEPATRKALKVVEQRAQEQKPINEKIDDLRNLIKNRPKPAAQVEYYMDDNTGREYSYDPVSGKSEWVGVEEENVDGGKMKKSRAKPRAKKIKTVKTSIKIISTKGRPTKTKGGLMVGGSFMNTARGGKVKSSRKKPNVSSINLMRVKNPTREERQAELSRQDKDRLEREERYIRNERKKAERETAKQERATAKLLLQQKKLEKLQADVKAASEKHKKRVNKYRGFVPDYSSVGTSRIGDFDDEETTYEFPPEELVSKPPPPNVKSVTEETVKEILSGSKSSLKKRGRPRLTAEQINEREAKAEEEKRLKDEQKVEEKRLKEEQKAGEKRLKDEQKSEKKRKSNNIKNVKFDDDQSIKNKAKKDIAREKAEINKNIQEEWKIIQQRDRDLKIQDELIDQRYRDLKARDKLIEQKKEKENLEKDKQLLEQDKKELQNIIEDLKEPGEEVLGSGLRRLKKYRKIRQLRQKHMVKKRLK